MLKDKKGFNVFKGFKLIEKNYLEMKCNQISSVLNISSRLK